MNKEQQELDLIRSKLGGLNDLNNFEALDFILFNYPDYGTNFTEEFYNDTKSQFENRPEIRGIGEETIAGSLEETFVPMGGAKGFANSFRYNTYNMITNTIPTAFGTALTGLFNPSRAIQNTEKEIAQQKLLLDDPKYLKNNPYKKIEEYDKYTGLPTSYVKVEDYSSVTADDWLMGELREIGLGNEMQRPEEKKYGFAPSYSSFIYQPNSRGEIEKNIELLTEDLKDKQEALANPGLVKKMQTWLFNNGKSIAESNRIASDEYTAKKRREDINYRLYEEWQQNEPTIFSFGKSVENAPLGATFDLPFGDYQFTSNVLHPAIALREFNNFSQSIISTGGYGAGSKIAYKSLAKAVTKMSKRGIATGSVFNVKSLGYLDQVYLTALSAGSTYKSTYDSLEESGLNEEDRIILAAEGANTAGVIEGALERLGLTAVFGHLGRSDLKFVFSRNFSGHRLAQYTRAKSAQGFKDKLSNWLFTGGRAVGGLSVAALGEGMTEAYQSAWGVAQEEAIKKGYGTDPLEAMDNLFNAVTKELSTDPFNYLAGPFSDKEEIKRSFASGFSGGGAMRLASRGLTKAARTTGKIYHAFNDDVVFERNKDGVPTQAKMTPSGDNKKLAFNASIQNDGEVEYDEIDIISYAEYVGRLLEDKNNAPRLKDLIYGRKQSLGDGDLNDVEKHINKVQNESSFSGIVANLIKYAINKEGVKDINSFIEGLDLSDSAKKELRKEVRNAYKKSGKITISKKIDSSIGDQQLKVYEDKFNSSVDDLDFNSLVDGFTEATAAQAEQALFNLNDIPVSVFEGEVPDVISSSGVSPTPAEMDEQESLEKKKMVSDARNRLGLVGSEEAMLYKATNPSEIIDYFILKMSNISDGADMTNLVDDIMFLSQNKPDTLAQTFKAMGDAKDPAEFLESISKFALTESQVNQLSEILTLSLYGVSDTQEKESKAEYDVGSVLKKIQRLEKLMEANDQAQITFFQKATSLNDLILMSLNASGDVKAFIDSMISSKDTSWDDMINAEDIAEVPPDTTDDIPDDIFNAQIANATGMDMDTITESIDAQKKSEIKETDNNKIIKESDKIADKLCIRKTRDTEGF